MANKGSDFVEPGAEPSVARILAFTMLDAMASEATNEPKTLRLSLCGFSNPDISELLAISLPSVHQNLYKARKKLKQPVKKMAKKASALPANG